jgi:TRAP-type C4-dicarboxylate transport system permease small subunit
MTSLSQRTARFSSFLNWFAGTSLVAMMTLVCCDVVMRLFQRPILGVYEIVGFLGTATASLATAYTTVQRGHVSVSLIVMHLPQKVQLAVSIITHFLSLVLFTLLTFECVRYGNESKASGELSLTLEWHLFPLLYGMAFSFLVVAVVLGVDLWNILRTKEPWPQSG